MSKKTTKLMGLSFSDFNAIVDKGEEIHLQPARLIPFDKPGDEKALTAIFLSSLRLIEEFRKDIFKAMNITSSGKIHVYTEVEFALFKGINRPDGLILFERGKKIVDAILIEVKNGNNVLDENQISKYFEIAKEYTIPKLLTVSNQFVSYPTQSPLSLKASKNISLFHLSWSHILTIAHILLFENDDNISDEDQCEVMKEVVEYFESPKSGILGYNQMKKGWTETVEKIHTGTPLKADDAFVHDSVSSWLEEERDMALILSRKLGLMVRSGKSKYKDNLKARIEDEIKGMIADKYLESIFQIEGAVSNIYVQPQLDKKTVVMSVTISAPLDRKSKGQISWVINQIKTCEKKNPSLFSHIKDNIIIGIKVKYSKCEDRFKLAEIDDAYDRYKTKEIQNFSIMMIKDYETKFKSRKGFVQEIEKMLVDYYQGVVQYLRNWEKPAPKISEHEDDS